MTANRIDLWHLARHLLTTMMLALGAPAAVADRPKLTRKAKREITSWLAPLECLVRKMLLVEAAALPRPPETPRQARAVSKAMIAAWMKKRPRKTYVVNPARPATWRVTFRLSIPLDPLRRKTPPIELGPRIRPLQHHLVRQVWRERAALGEEAERKRRLEERRAAAPRKLAERYEALRRVIEDPNPHAERLARKLWRQRGGAAFAARRVAETRMPRRQPLFDDIAAVIAPFVLAAPQAFPNTS